jgi:nucleoside-diphosphate-sugar epimerase
MQKVMVTGANGFIGNYCVNKLLKSGFDVHALSSRLSGRDSKGIHWHKIDLLKNSAFDLLSLIKPDKFIHLAWSSEHGKFWTDPSNTEWAKSSIQLAKDFQKAGGKRFVMAGSCAEYEWGENAHGRCIEGVTSEKPATLYGQCKKQVFDELQTLAQKYNFSFANGRVFFLYGPGESKARLVPSVISSLLHEVSPTCTDGRQIRDFMFVSDVADALVALTTSSVEGAVNIASGTPQSLRSLIEKIAEIMNSHTKINFGSIPRSQNDPEVLTASVGRLKQEVGFIPQVSLDEGIQMTLKWMNL